MSVTVLEAPLDPTLPAPGPTLVGAPEAIEAPPVPPPPTPGDPDVAWVPPLFADGLRTQVAIIDAVKREKLDELDGARVDDFDEDVELLVPPSAAVAVGPWDPWVASVATATEQGPDGVPVHMWEPKRHALAIGVNGVTRFAGIFRQPLDHGSEVLLPARGYGQLFHETFLGRVEQEDLYAGWGNFEGLPLGSTPPGMRLPAGVTAVVVADAARGTRCLEVTGPLGAWAEGPRVPVAGAADHRRSVEGSAFVRMPSGVEEGQNAVLTLVRLGGTIVHPDYATARRGQTRIEGGRWDLDGPVASAAQFSANATTHQVSISLAAHPGGARYDLVRPQQGILTGFLTPRDTAHHLERLLRDLKAESLGGFPWGVQSRIESLSGDEFAQTWNHNGNHLAADVAAAILDREGACEAFINPQGVMVIAKRLGQLRTDFRFDATTCISWEWADDPGAQADVMVGLTGRGSGTSLLTSTVSQPRIPNRHRTTKVTRIPNGLSLNAGDAWTLRHARVHARQQRTATAVLDWWAAEEIAIGDVAEAALSTGRHGVWNGPGGGLFRVINKRWLPAARRCIVSLGQA